MKKNLTFLAVFVMFISFSTAIYAADETKATKSAYAEFDNETLSFAVTLHPIPQTYSSGYYVGLSTTSDTAGTTQVLFDSSTVKLGKDEVQFASGTVCAKISSTLTAQKKGKYVYVYTDNKNNTTSSYNAKTPRGPEDWGGGYYVTRYDGLIRSAGTATISDAGIDKGDYAPIKIYSIKATVADSGSYSKASPISFANSRYLFDKSDIATKDSADVTATYLKPKQIIGTTGVNGGIWIGNGDTDIPFNKDDYSQNADVIMFFGAEFYNVMGGDNYKTETISFVYANE